MIVVERMTSSLNAPCTEMIDSWVFWDSPGLHITATVTEIVVANSHLNQRIVRDEALYIISQIEIRWLWEVLKFILGSFAKNGLVHESSGITYSTGWSCFSKASSKIKYPSANIPAEKYADTFTDMHKVLKREYIEHEWIYVIKLAYLCSHKGCLFIFVFKLWASII